MKRITKKEYSENTRDSDCRKMHYWKSGHFDRRFCFRFSVTMVSMVTTVVVVIFRATGGVIRLETRAPAFNRSLKGHMDKRAA